MSTPQTSTPPTTRVRRHGAALLMAALLSGPLTACGSDEQPAPTAAEQVPALGKQLERIDTALAGKRFPRARTLLERLTQQVIAARGAGDLDAEAADGVLAAASRLLAELPEPKPEPTPTVTVTPPPPPSGEDEGDGDDGDDESGEGDRGEGDNKKEAQKKREEAQKKAEERRKEREEQQEDQERDD